MKQLLLSISIAACLSSCGVIMQDESTVVYALGTREGFDSPVAASLTPICPALSFIGDNYTVSGRHLVSIRKVAEKAKQSKIRLLIAAYTSPGLPEDHARSLSERRAQDVRQQLIEMGVDAGSIHTLGLGNDFSPSGPSSDVVVIYEASPSTISPVSDSNSSN